MDSPSADIDALKRILKHYIVSVGASEVVIMQFDFFFQLRSTNQNMYDTTYPCCIAQTTAAANTSTSVVVLCLCCAGRLQGIHQSSKL